MVVTKPPRYHRIKPMTRTTSLQASPVSALTTNGSPFSDVKPFWSVMTTARRLLRRTAPSLSASERSVFGESPEGYSRSLPSTHAPGLASLAQLSGLLWCEPSSESGEGCASSKDVVTLRRAQFSVLHSDCAALLSEGSTRRWLLSILNTCNWLGTEFASVKGQGSVNCRI